MREAEFQDDAAEMQEEDHDEEEEMLRQLRSEATKLLLGEEWKECIHVYSRFISLCNSRISKLSSPQNPSSDRASALRKSLCLALSNRAESRFRLREFRLALRDCDDALQIENPHFKTLLCKGKIFLALDRYTLALDCFSAANRVVPDAENGEILNGFLDKCRKLEGLSETGGFDLSNWILNRDRVPPDLAEYLGPVEINKSEISGRGLFATRNVECGTLFLVTRAVAIERGIMSQNQEKSQLANWNYFVDKVLELTSKCNRTQDLISTLSTGVDEDSLDVPDTDLFRPKTDDSRFSGKNLDMDTVLGVLDVNSLVEEAISVKFLGKSSNDHSHYHGIGLWLLTSFINHSCEPNVRRSHVGDHVLVHASRDIKMGEELTFAYFDVLSPLETRQGKAKSWGFVCKCKRCKIEGGSVLRSNHELREIEVFLKRGLGLGVGEVVYRLEEGMRRWAVRGRVKGYLRASFWGAYAEVLESEKLKRKWGGKIPPNETLVDSVVSAVGCDERIAKVGLGGMKRNCGVLEMDQRALKLGRGLYGKVMKKKQALKCLLKLDGLS
ncbi:unnamed protein product [Cuscuta campestris]|uniref:SET domain-containing protein n=1 Tax=Cuscuta campestris TaxID=132261 RepID=A0A484MD68_9ASTE|nr:unnamed protein product [Cuscuta campestris]